MIFLDALHVSSPRSLNCISPIDKYPTIPHCECLISFFGCPKPLARKKKKVRLSSSYLQGPPAAPTLPVTLASFLQQSFTPNFLIHSSCSEAPAAISYIRYTYFALAQHSDSGTCLPYPTATCISLSLQCSIPVWFLASFHREPSTVLRP